MDVPGELTRGNAAHVSAAPQDSSTNEPDTHCANEPCTHAFFPSKDHKSVFMHVNDDGRGLPVQGELEVKEANWAFNC